MQDWYKLTILKRKGFLIPFFIFIFLLVIAYARDYTQDYNNALTRSIADTIYCKIGGSCGITGGANLTGSGKSDNIAIWYNTTHLTYNTSAIGGGTGNSQELLLNATDNIYINNIRGNATFNETKLNNSIDTKLTGVTYYPTSFNVTYGQSSGHNNIGNLSFDDNDIFNITENTGANAILFYVNYTGVVSFNTLEFHGYYSGGATHEVEVSVWDYTDSNWEYYFTIDNTATETSKVTTVNGINHISSGLTQLRFQHIGTGINTHKLFIDQMVLKSGVSGGQADTTPFLRLDGTRAMTGNLNSSAYNITADYFFGRIPFSNITNVPALGNTTVEIWGKANNNSFVPFNGATRNIYLNNRNLTDANMINATDKILSGVARNNSYLDKGQISSVREVSGETVWGIPFTNIANSLTHTGIIVDGGVSGGFSDAAIASTVINNVNYTGSGGSPVTINTQGLSNSVYVYGSHTIGGEEFNMAESNKGITNTLFRIGTQSGYSLIIDNYGMSNSLGIQTKTTTGGVVTENNYGGHFSVTAGTSNNNAGSLTRSNFGFYGIVTGTTVYQDSTCYGAYTSSSGCDSNYGFYSAGSNINYFGGNVSIGTTSSSAQLHTTDTVWFVGVYDDVVGATNRDLYIDNTGKLGYVSSSETTKTNIENITARVNTSKVYELRPVVFNRINSGGIDETGLIAEEVQLIMPELVSYKRGENTVCVNVTVGQAVEEQCNTTYYQTNIPETVSYSKLPILILTELKKLLERLTILEKKVDLLQEENNKLQNCIEISDDFKTYKECINK